MDIGSSLAGIGLLLLAMLLLTLVEAVLPLRARGAWNRRHLVPNLTLTAITFVVGACFNALLLLGLLFLQARGWGVLNLLELPPWLELALAVLVLDFAWYATHVSMHKSPLLWRFHAVHHSDPAMDVTSTVRQHPGETVIRYAYLAAFGFAFGVSPAGFAIYRVWSALNGQVEHANIRLPQWLDTAISTILLSPNFHKVHHSRDARFTDTNYGNIFTLWDRLCATFTPSRLGRDVDYGLDGHDDAASQTLAALLIAPFRRTRRTPRREPARA